MRLMAQVWQCTKTDPIIDFSKLAKLGGYSTPKSAQDQWNKIKSKIKAAATNDDPQTPKVQASPLPESPSSSSAASLGNKRSSPDDANTLLAAKRRKRVTKKAVKYKMSSESSCEETDEAPLDNG